MKREPVTYREPQPGQAAPMSPPPPGYGMPTNVPGTVISEEDRTPAMLIHLSPLLAFVLPGLGNLLGPLAAWLIYRDRSPMLDDQGKDAVNFQISMWIYSTLGLLLLGLLAVLGFAGGFAGAAAGADAVAGFGIFSGIGLILLLILLATFFYIIPIIFMIVAVMAVSDGRPYHYPFTLRLLK